MPIFRGEGGSGDSSTDAYASEIAEYANTASTKADEAAASASAASTSASNAATSESNASTSASNAATSASNASTSASNAATSETNAAASYDSFDDRYLGAKTSDPTLDNDGDALLTGALYFNSTSNEMKVYNGSSWGVVSGGGGSGTVTSVAMTVPTGLSVSGSPVTSSGTLAVTYTAGYAIPTTAKQTQWDTAYGWGDHSVAGYLTSFTETNDLTAAVTWANVPDANITQSSVTQHQAALSITESQISDFGTYLSSGDTAASLTITSADINGGTVDGTNIGATTAGTGAFTTLSATGNTTITAELTADSYNESKGTVTSSAGSLTIDCHNGNVFSLALSENVTSTTFSNPPATGTAFGFSLFVTQDATARTIAWPAAVAWPSGTAPTLSTTSGDVDIFTFTTFNGGTTWYGIVSGQAL